MPIVCRFIATQEVVTVCKDIVKTGILIARAVAEGTAQANELEEVVMDDATFAQFMSDYTATHPPVPDPRLPYIRSYVQKMIALGITKAEMKAVFSYIAGKIE